MVAIVHSSYNNLVKVESYQYVEERRTYHSVNSQ